MRYLAVTNMQVLKNQKAVGKVVERVGEAMKSNKKSVIIVTSFSKIKQLLNKTKATVTGADSPV